MIFDIYIEIDFAGKTAPLKKKSFKSDENYAKIKGEEHCLQFSNGYTISLNRRRFNDCYLEKDGCFIWVYGYVYSNKAYEKMSSEKCKLLTAAEISKIRSDHPQDWDRFLKGSYVIIIYSDEKRELTAYTDYLNVLPLYYAYDKNKLIVSSNTTFILKEDWVDKTPDKLALTMQYLFDYMLGEHYFVKGIKRMENATHYTFNSNGVNRKKVWDVSELKHKHLLPKKTSLDLVAEQLKENVNLYAGYSSPVLVAMTGGFDGRSNVAMLNKTAAEFKCYSYGLAGSKQISIPEKVAEHLGINYEAVVLGEDFAKNFFELNREATYFSNGTAPIGFANKPYAYSKLSVYSDTIITGLFGSEILRPLHNNQIQVNDQSFEIFLNEDLMQGIKNAIQNREKDQVFDFDIKSQTQELYNFFNENYFSKYEKYDKVTRFFFFIIQEGTRKYFSQELSIERVYVTTKIPYFDLDTVQLIYKTTWAGMYNGFLGKSKFKRRKGQLLYAYIMRKYKPEIMDIEMDRGYKPSTLLWPFPFNYLAIALGVYKAKRYLKAKKGVDTFDTRTWAKETMKKIKSLNNKTIQINLEPHTEKESEALYLTERHMASLKLFFSDLDA